MSYLQKHTSNLHFLFFCKFQTISDKILWEFKKKSLIFSLFPYSILRAYNIAWRKFCSLFLNIVKRWKERETQKFPNRSFSQSFCHWLYLFAWNTVVLVISGLDFPFAIWICLITYRNRSEALFVLHLLPSSLKLSLNAEM